jgi:hypothetical protein
MVQKHLTSNMHSLAVAVVPAPAGGGAASASNQLGSRCCSQARAPIFGAHLACATYAVCHPVRNVGVWWLSGGAYSVHVIAAERVWSTGAVCSRRVLASAGWLQVS